ncbi:MAG: hypothetical protein ABIM89_02150 [Mycobacteriales bacterium]
MNKAERPSGRRVVRRRPSFLAELTDDIEPDDPPAARDRLLAILLLIMSVALLTAGVAFVIMQTLARGR